jgi:hypothetical protein
MHPFFIYSGNQNQPNVERILVLKFPISDGNPKIDVDEEKYRKEVDGALKEKPVHVTNDFLIVTYIITPKQNYKVAVS